MERQTCPEATYQGNQYFCTRSAVDISHGWTKQQQSSFTISYDIRQNTKKSTREFKQRIKAVPQSG